MEVKLITELRVMLHYSGSVPGVSVALNSIIQLQHFHAFFSQHTSVKFLVMFTQNHVTYVLYEIMVRLTKKFIYDMNIYIISDYCKTLYKLKNIQGPFQSRSSSY
jgi:hypothetical protein